LSFGHTKLYVIEFLQMQSTSQRGIIATVMTRSTTFSKFLDMIGLQKATGSLIDFAIRDYQLYISPHKGFSCAYRKLHGGSSCSGYFREIVATEGLTKSLYLFPNRLTEWKEAFLILQSQQSTSSKEGKKKYDCCDMLAGNFSSCDLDNCNCDTNDGGDCGSCDGGSYDCNF
jgi:putative component of membrane protein insertase Oxa1/YidC/SpoIIIJ protein YidD